jgi:hypothetical protein
MIQAVYITNSHIKTSLKNCFAKMSPRIFYSPHFENYCNDEFLAAGRKQAGAADSLQ